MGGAGERMAWEIVVAACGPLSAAVARRLMLDGQQRGLHVEIVWNRELSPALRVAITLEGRKAEVVVVDGAPFWPIERRRDIDGFPWKELVQSLAVAEA